MFLIKVPILREEKIGSRENLKREPFGQLIKRDLTGIQKD
jgi:hypothetical protein